MIDNWLLAILYNVPNRLLKLSERFISNYTKSPLVYLSYCSLISKRRRKTRKFVLLLRKRPNRKLTIVADYQYIDEAGLTDRLNGMIALYFYCKRHSYSFKIMHSVPYQLERFLAPGKSVENWSLPETALDMDVGGGRLFFALPSIRKRSLMYKVLDNLCALPGLSWLYVNCMVGVDLDEFSIGFNDLFAPTEILEGYIKRRLVGLSEYETASFRFCQLLGDFDDVITEPLSASDRIMYMQVCYDKLSSIKASYPIIVTSDSISFLRYVMECHDDRYIVFLDEQIDNVGMKWVLTDNEVCRLLSDYLIISRAKKVWQIKIGKMYNSRFPEYAAGINHVPYQLIEADIS